MPFAIINLTSTARKSTFITIRELLEKKREDQMEKLLELINKKIEEIENYAIDTQENEERYIHEINCLLEAKFLLSQKN